MTHTDSDDTHCVIDSEDTHCLPVSEDTHWLWGQTLSHWLWGHTLSLRTHIDSLTLRTDTVSGDTHCLRDSICLILLGSTDPGSVILTVFSKVLMKSSVDWLQHLLTPESPVHRLDSAVDQAAPSLLSPAGCFLSDPVLWDERGLTSELKPEKNSWSLTDCRSSTWIKNKT